MDTEASLAERARSGDLTALAELVRANYSFLHSYLLKITLDPEKAADLTQETLLRAVEKIRQFDGTAKFSTWLITIATRLAIDHHRRKSREWRFLRSQAREEPARLLRWRVETAGAEWSDLLDALARMPQETRLAVVLKHYYGYTQQEIAAIAGVPEGTVKSRVHLGLKWLRRELTDYEKDKRQRPAKS
ncbi:RNA polymerase sigma factor SigY [Gorillibacterium sp. sgz500922]|uniref:RNA polymerase sigma factor SigY n=1 Tax=Gorillibacterium sp. sgz500922 TaxID=3446694 RepID=UPI003F67C729